MAIGAGRAESVTYVLERPGKVDLPGRQLEAAVGEVEGAAGTGDLAGRPDGRPFIGALVVLILVSVLIFRYRRASLQRWRAWRTARRESESQYFRRATASIRAGDRK
jgi:hypothetical protein